MTVSLTDSSNPIISLTDSSNPIISPTDSSNPIISLSVFGFLTQPCGCNSLKSSGNNMYHHL